MTTDELDKLKELDLQTALEKYSRKKKYASIFCSITLAMVISLIDFKPLTIGFLAFGLGFFFDSIFRNI